MSMNTELDKYIKTSMGLPADAVIFKGTLAGHSSGVSEGIHGTSICGILAGKEFLFDDESGNHGIQCTVIIIPEKRLHVADSSDGMRVKYGNVLDRMASMFDESAWKEELLK